MSPARGAVVAALVPLASGVLALAAQWGLAHQPRPQLNEVLYLPDARTAKHLDLGLGEAWADWMHIQALLYVVQDFDLEIADKAAAKAALARGETPHAVAPKYVWLYQLYDSMTELDPYFLQAYLYGARFLSLLKKSGDGEVTGADLAIRLLEKATALPAMAQRWEIWNELGMVWYMDKQDIEQARVALARAAALPGCPLLVSGFASRIAEGSDHELEVLDILRTRRDAAQQAGDVIMYRALDDRIRTDEARVVWHRLQAAADAIRAERGAPAADLAALEARVVRDRRWDPAVFDLTGGFWFDRDANTVESLRLAPAEEERRRRNFEVEIERYRLRNGVRPPTLAAIPADPKAELRAVHHHPRQGWTWHYDPGTGTVRSVRRGP